MIDEALAWSEVWATLLPILIWVIRKPTWQELKPIKIYLCIAVVVYSLCDSAYSYIGLFQDNRFLYNIISIFRLFIFCWFFFLNGIVAKKIQKKFLLFIIIFILILNFIYFNFFEKFSSTYTIEAVILLALCVIYFLKKLRSEDASTNFDAGLIIITGLAVYEASCFFIFLYYDTLSDSFKKFAIDLWQIHNVFYIVFCLFIARAFLGRIKENKLWV